MDWEVEEAEKSPEKRRSAGQETGIGHDRRLVTRTAERRAYDLRNVPNAVRLVRPLPVPGETVHAIMGGDFHAWDLVPAILELAGCRFAGLWIATLGFNLGNNGHLCRLIDQGRIQRATILCSDYFAKSDLFPPFLDPADHQRMLTPIQTKILDDLRAIWKPTPQQTVTDWCEQNLLLTSRQTEHPGPYSTANRPCVREPLECWRDPSVTDVVLCWGSQTSKTTTLMAGLCWLIDNEPSPVLWLMPTELLARSFSRTRWMPFLEESEVMRRHFPDDRKKITLLEQHFDRCTLTFVGSNSPANLASRPIRILVADEVDKFAAATSREAAALELALQRTKSYSSSKHFLTSTPTTLEGEIWQHFLRGDQRRFFIPCPHCERPIKLLWPQVKWDPQAKDESGTWAACAPAPITSARNAPAISQTPKRWSRCARGSGAPRIPNAIPGVRSYHLSREEIREAQLAHGVTDNHVGIDMTRHLSRKDIAALIDPRMTTDVVRRNERRLGLDKARIRLNRRVILYRRTQALNALRAKGFDV